MNTYTFLRFNDQLKTRSLNLFFAIGFILGFSACQPGTEQTSGETPTAPVIDTTPAVTGIGGIFFQSEHPDTTLMWYEKNMGMKTDLFGAVFETRNALNPTQENYLRWSPMRQKDSFFLPSKERYMINFRVRNLDAMVRQMRNNGVVIIDSIMTFDYGKFVHIMDPDGRKIELWEPVDSVLKKMGGHTNK